MIRRVVIRPEAKQDLRAAKAWYRTISRQLATDLIEQVDRAIALARERPLAFQVVHRTFRRILLHQFPYALFYDASREDRIVIVALLHQARDPEALASRNV